MVNVRNQFGIGGQRKGEPGRNPKGRPPGYQSFVERAKYLLDQHTIESVKEFTLDERKFNKLSVYDGMIMRRIVEAVSDNGKGSMDSLLDRLLGKPPQYIETKVDASIEVTAKERQKQAKEQANELLATLVSKTGLPTSESHENEK